VAAQAAAPAAGREDVRDLLPLALSRPREALTRASKVLAGQPGAFEISVAHQAAGIVLREFGDVRAGIAEFRRALSAARRTGSTEREADVLASLAVALVYVGRAAAGLATFDHALQLATGVQKGQVLHRRCLALLALGHHARALSDARQAVVLLRRAGDKLWTARAVNARGLVNHAMGNPSRADADFAEAERLFAETSQDLESVYMVHNRALVAFSLNDIPAALSYFSEAASRYEPLGVLVPDLAVDRCLTLLAAGLARDALAEADAVVLDLERMHGQATKRAELLLIAADSALATAQPRAAIDRARAADRLFRSQRSTWYLARTRLLLIRARYRTEAASGPLLREAGRAAGQLERVGSGHAAQAHLLAGRIALDLGRPRDADRHFTAAAHGRRRGPAMSRASGWLGAALGAETAGQTRRMLAACGRGLEVLDEYRFTLGASELRAQATAHGAELAMLAQRHAAGAGRPRLLLAWSERWRATTSAVPAVRPSADPELNTRLAAFRQASSQLAEARRQGRPIARLGRDQQRRERVVRAYALQAPGRVVRPASAVDIGHLLDELGGTRLVEIVHVDGVAYVLVCGAGKVRQFTAGRLSDATQAARFARFALRRLARHRTGDDVKSALAVLAATAPKLQEALLGPAVRYLGDGEVIIVPPGRLHAIPWALLPALGDRVVSVAPSARAWLRARAVPPPSHRHVTLVRGPGLLTAGAEVPQIAPLYENPTVLAGPAATTRQVLRSLEGAWLAHIAAHGTFRADSPLFSSLRMADGPLTVYDFEQLSRAPYRLVLPSCDSAVQAPVGADELLGLVSSLLPLGTAGIIAAVVQLNDEAAVPVMSSLHSYLHRGHSLAAAMCSIRRELAGDPVQHATARSLVALGAA
jgi:tetratricopeptide (TPR) repeat protein